MRNITWLVAAVSLLGAPVALADGDTTQTAQAHRAAAQRFLLAHDLPQGLRELETAYLLRPDAELALQMGYLHEALGDPDAARRLYLRHLGDPSPAQPRLRGRLLLLADRRTDDDAGEPERRRAATSRTWGSSAILGALTGTALLVGAGAGVAAGLDSARRTALEAGAAAGTLFVWGIAGPLSGH